MTTQKDITKSLDSFSYKELIGRKLTNSIPDLNGMTTADIEKPIPWLGINHTIASNTSLKDRSPYYREYCSLIQDSQNPSIEEIDLGFYDEELEGRFFYRITHYYYEDTYSSTYPFYEWEYERFKYMQEILKRKDDVLTLKWERFNTDESDVELTINLGSYIGILIESDSEFTLIDEEDNTINSSEQRLSIPISQKSQYRIKAETIREEQEVNNIEDFVPALLKPTYITINLSGSAIAQRSYHPMGEIEELESTILHKPNTPLQKRLLPPGKTSGPDFPTSYWNYNIPLPLPSSRSIDNLFSQPSLS